MLEYHALLDYVKKKYINGKDNYLFIDEVQMCDGFEKAINSLHSSEKYDIYITGSNAFLLSSDLATLFTGRTFEIEVYPFSFKEFVNYYQYTDMQQAYIKYLTEGGMPGAYVYKTEKDKHKYIRDIFETLILRDIKQKYKIRNDIVLEKVTDYLTDNISNLTSPRKLTEAIKGKGDTADHKTVDKYINYLCRAFAFYKVRRYDIQRKKYLASTEKYYLCDHSFKYAKLGTKNPDYGRSMENIVAIELMRRGYELYVGILYKKEIDFVAIKENEKIYIQVANSIEDEKTKERELAPLQKIKDAYPKMIITRTGYPYGIPVNHWYHEKDGKIYFHGAREGHKIDAIKNCDKVSFCVYDKGYREDGDWPLHIRSVVVFGRIRMVEEQEKAVEICTNLCKKFTDDAAYIEQELLHSGGRVLCLELSPESMTGKLVKES